MSDHSDDPPANGDKYNVGYRKPPAHSRFQKGSSGNPKGRPAASKNFATLIERELDTRITVTENGKRKKKRKLEVIVAQIINKALSADPRFVSMLLVEQQKIDSRNQATKSDAEAATEPFAEADAKVMDGLLARLASGGRQNNE